MSLLFVADKMLERPSEMHGSSREVSKYLCRSDNAGCLNSLDRLEYQGAGQIRIY